MINQDTKKILSVLSLICKCVRGHKIRTVHYRALSLLFDVQECHEHVCLYLLKSVGENFTNNVSLRQFCIMKITSAVTLFTVTTEFNVTV